MSGSMQAVGVGRGGSGSTARGLQDEGQQQCNLPGLGHQPCVCACGRQQQQARRLSLLHTMCMRWAITAPWVPNAQPPRCTQEHPATDRPDPAAAARLSLHRMRVSAGLVDVSTDGALGVLRNAAALWALHASTLWCCMLPTASIIHQHQQPSESGPSLRPQSSLDSSCASRIITAAAIARLQEGPQSSQPKRLTTLWLARPCGAAGHPPCTRTCVCVCVLL